MPYTLKGRNVLITGGSRGLGALLCEKFAAEGSNIVVNYVSSKDSADQVAEKCKGLGVKAVADIGVVEDSIRLVKEAVQQLGGLDIICWSTNVMSQLVLMQEAAPIFNANSDGGVFLISSSAAGISCGGSSMGYSVTKAAGLHLMKCLASTQGPKIRINAVLPGLLLTEWGMKYSEERIKIIKNMSALKQEVSS
ncbi:uncharacterized protein Z518_05931 [Rhinocladiella mackenziei CBS 650.93]|uniref:Uncharacterized protein n=1 Tax=Rhinocladiella mackenziei CBS 650.93 TaxID=1442369 RepID=A0A0D2IH28_9EURO|nr:uncharacterized protein Z518_05931 [Rhinocladiella mackenziei CBS 650.93]KIX05059.1 hypothetical protein Z518_05931 [Rhinocladiella mackenziei CBS 650.93]